MRLKHILIIPLFVLSVSLCSCSAELSEPYSTERLSQLNIAAETDDGYKAAGFASALCVPEDEAPLNSEGVNAAAFGLFNVATGEYVSGSGLFEQVYPASTTKILTCLLALENGDLDAIVTIPEESDITVSGSSMADLKPGDQLSLRDLLYGLMVPSGNDAAVAIAHHISGGVSEFSDLMNERAHSIGATHSHFSNPHGLPSDDHYTTAYDMYLIFNEAMKHPEFAKFASMKEYTAQVTGADGTVREVTWENGNGFLAGRFQLPDGVELKAGKTGHTNAAGFCLVLSETAPSGDELISVVFNAPTYDDLYNGMSTLVGKGL